MILTKEEYCTKFKEMWPEADDATVQMSYAFYNFISGPKFTKEEIEALNNTTESQTQIFFHDF